MEKAKYEVLRGIKILYFAVTSTRNTEDMVMRLREIYDDKGYAYRIRKTENGNSFLVYDNIKKYTPKTKEKLIDNLKQNKPVIDNESGLIFGSISECAKHIGVYRMQLYRKLKKHIPGYRYSLFKEKTKTA